MTELTQEHFEIIDRNKARAYELKKKDREKSYTLQELKASHQNFMLDQMLESLKLWAKTKSLNKKT